MSHSSLEGLVFFMDKCICIGSSSYDGHVIFLHGILYTQHSPCGYQLLLDIPIICSLWLIEQMFQPLFIKGQQCKGTDCISQALLGLLVV